MQLYIHAIGELTEPWLNDGICQYKKRIPSPYQLTICSYSTPKRIKNKSIRTIQQQESQLLLQHKKPGDILVYMDQTGKSLTSQGLANQLDNWRQRAPNIRFLIGGPDGHLPEAVTGSDCVLSLSDMTLPHGLARLVLVEQIYRAIMIQNNHPYHR